MRNLMLCSSLLICFFGACKKDKPVQSLEDKIVAKWNFVKFDDIHVPADPSDATNSFTPPPGSYIEFLATSGDNIHYNDNGGGANYTTLVYTKVNNESFGMQDLVFTIETATATSLVFSNESTLNGVKHIRRYTLSKPYVTP
jgi:hypothetical protein